MKPCARCATDISPDGEWVEIQHNHEYMCFESIFCGTDCAVAYLSEDLSAAE